MAWTGHGIPPCNPRARQPFRAWGTLVSPRSASTEPVSERSGRSMRRSSTITGRANCKRSCQPHNHVNDADRRAVSQECQEESCFRACSILLHEAAGRGQDARQLPPRTTTTCPTGRGGAEGRCRTRGQRTYTGLCGCTRSRSTTAPTASIHPGCSTPSPQTHHRRAAAARGAGPTGRQPCPGAHDFSFAARCRNRIQKDAADTAAAAASLRTATLAGAVSHHIRY